MRIHQHPTAESDHNGILLILGGIGPPGLRFLETLKREAKRFRHVIFIPALDSYNAHDNIDNLNQHMLSSCNFAGVHYLNRHTVKLDGTLYSGAIGWHTQLSQQQYKHVYTSLTLHHLPVGQHAHVTSYGHQAMPKDIELWSKRDTQFLESNPKAVKITVFEHRLCEHHKQASK